MLIPDPANQSREGTHPRGRGEGHFNKGLQTARQRNEERVDLVPEGTVRVGEQVSLPSKQACPLSNPALEEGAYDEDM